MSVHSDFILAPVSDILCDTSTITHSMSWGIEMYPLWDNILQSVFIKMTGAQEQKMKCICWEIATIDFDLRRDIYFPWELKECSRMTDKRKVISCSYIAKIQNQCNSTISLSFFLFIYHKNSYFHDFSN